MTELNKDNEQITERNKEDVTNDLGDLMKVANTLFSEETLSKLSEKLEENSTVSVNEEVLSNLNSLGLNRLNGLNNASLLTGAGLGGLGSLFKQISTSSSTNNEVNKTLKEIMERLEQMENAQNNESQTLLTEMNGRLLNLQNEMNQYRTLQNSITDLQAEMDHLQYLFEEMSEKLSKKKKK